MRARTTSLAILAVAALLILAVAGCKKKPKTPACDGNDDCADGLVCVNKQCVQCAASADCGDGKECKEGACVAKAECAKDLDCPDGKVCQAGACRSAGGPPRKPSRGWNGTSTPCPAAISRGPRT